MLKENQWKLYLIILGILIIVGIGIYLYNPETIKTIFNLPNRLLLALEFYTIPETQVPTGNLVNVTSEGNFTHLTIDNTTAPYDNLVRYYNFDGDKENTLLTKHYDWTGNNDGTGVDTTVVNSNGCNGYDDCVHFSDYYTDGKIDYIQTNFNGTEYNELSFSFWIKFGDLGHVMYPFDNSPGSVGYILRTSGDDWETYTYTGGGLCTKTKANFLVVNEWVHLIYSFNGTHLAMFVNGVQETTPTACSGTGIVDSASKLKIGSDYLPDDRYGLNGSMDEIMIFNKGLTAQQVTDIYNNQSARFLATGTQNIVNQSYMNISTGNNRVNVTTYIENNLGSSINLSVGYYDGSWSYTTPQVVSSGAVQTFTISSTSTNLTLNYTFYAGNSTNPFYSPIIKSNITFEAWNVASLDTCSPTSPLTDNYLFNCADNCVQSTNLDAGGFNVSVIGTGTFVLTANITNYKKLKIAGTDTSNICRVTCKGGCFT